MASISKLASGKFRVRWVAPDGSRSSRTFARKTDARVFANEIETDKQRGTYLDPEGAKTAFCIWAEECFSGRLNLRPATKARDESLLNNHILPVFGAAPLGLIDKLSIRRWIGDLADDYEPATVRECYRLLSGIMLAAVDERLIPESPCRRIPLPRIEPKEKRFLSPAQVIMLADRAGPLYRTLIYCGAYLGCRWQEFAGLKRKNLDLVNRRLRIVGTVERIGGQYRYVEDVKSRSSLRTLVIPWFLAEMLGQHLSQAPEGEFVFPSPDGRMLRYDNFRTRVWNKIVAEAALAPLTFHELRHTAAAIMIDQGADPLQIQRRLGHKDITTTYKHYGHLFPNREDGLNEALEEVFRKANSESEWPQIGHEGADNVREIDARLTKKGSSPAGSDRGRYWDRTSDLLLVRQVPVRLSPDAHPALGLASRGLSSFPKLSRERSSLC